MARLVVNPDSSDAWQIDLKPGSNSLGRSEENDVALNHDSISSSHCEIIVSGDGALLKDLGSTNGTFVEGELVEQAPLRDGQVFQAGHVEMRFLADAPATPMVRVVPPETARIPRPPPVPSVLVSSSAARCKSHPRTAARFHCPKCHHSFCELCVNTRPLGDPARKFCRTCGTECPPLKVRAAPKAPPRARFVQQVAQAFYFPLRRDGFILLAAGTFFLCVLNTAQFFSSFAPLYGLMATLILGVGGTGYLTSFFRRIVTGSATGEETMPDWPDITDFTSDILWPFLQLLGTLTVSFLPAIVVLLFVPKDYAFSSALRTAAFILGCAYFPMAFLAVSMLDSIAAANPIMVLPAILKVPLKYFLTVGVFAGVLVVAWTGDTHLPAFLPVPLVPTILSSFLGLYLLTVLMRVLGLLYRDSKEALHWFKR
jgi:hypothetical protein